MVLERKRICIFFKGYLNSKLIDELIIINNMELYSKLYKCFLVETDNWVRF